MRLVPSFLFCLALTGGLPQTRPDFSGKWTRIQAAIGEPIQTLTITQTQDALTVDDNGHRWVHKFNGTDSRNVTDDGTVQSSTSRWEGETLVTLFPIQGAPEGPYVLRVAVALDGKTLVVHATSTSQTTGAVFREETKRYSK